MKTRLTSFHTKPRKPLARAGSLKKTRIRVVGKSDTAIVKKEIQAVLREIVMLRDKGCLLRMERCGNELDAPGVVFQADHLIERSNSATYANPDLLVCLCKGCHGWKHFKKSNHDAYNAMVKEILPEHRVKLWEKCEAESWRTSKMDWQLELTALRQILSKMRLSTG